VQNILEMLLADRLTKYSPTLYRTRRCIIILTKAGHSNISEGIKKRPWRPIRLWDVEASTFSRKSTRRWRWGCQPYAPAAIWPQGRFLVLISVRVDPRAIERLEEFFFLLALLVGSSLPYWITGLITQFLDLSQAVGLLGRVISSSQAST
jgi:hypothetical protein